MVGEQTARSTDLDRDASRQAHGIAAQGAERALRLASAVWAAAWILLLVSTLVGAPQAVRSVAVAAACLALTSGAWAVLAFVKSPRSISVITGFALSALVNVLNMAPDHLGENVILETTWLNITAILCAFLLPRQRARVVIAALMTTTCFLQVSALLAAGALHMQWRMMLLACVYATFLGLAGVEAAEAVRSAAQAADDDAESRGIRAQRDAQSSAHREEVERVSRVLHDTFVNTLGAIRRGVEPGMLQALRDRCTRDVEQLDVLLPVARAASSMPASALAGALSVEAHMVGLTAQVVAPTRTGVELPLEIWQAALGSVREALTNIAKHAGTDHSTIRLTCGEQLLVIQVIDSGRGWSGKVPPGGGLDRSILQRVREAGGTVRIVTAPGQGTVLEYVWPLTARPDPSPTPSVRAPHAPPPLATVARRTSNWLVLLSIAETLIFLGNSPLIGSLAALLLIAGMLGLSLRTSRRVLPAWLVLLFIPTLAAVVALPGSGSGRCTAADPTAWGVDGAAALLLALCLMGPRIWSPLAGALGIATGLLLPALFNANPASCVTSGLLLLPVELGTIFAVTMFRRIVERLSEEAAANNAEATAMHVQAAAQAAREFTWRARLHSVSAAVGPLLNGIAAGRIDPTAADTRSRAGHAETTLRSLLRIDTRLGELGDLLAGAVVNGLQREQVVEVRNAGMVPTPTGGQLLAIRSVLDAAVAASGRRGSLQLSLLPHGAGATLTAIVPTSARVLTPELGAELASLHITVEQVALDGETLLSLSWA